MACDSERVKTVQQVLKTDVVWTCSDFKDKYCKKLKLSTVLQVSMFSVSTVWLKSEVNLYPNSGIIIRMQILSMFPEPYLRF